jgi:soluble lytic murein transglycosylase-like protein
MVTIQPETPPKRPEVLEELETGYLMFKSRKTARMFQAIITEAASRYRVEPEIVKAIIMAESNYNPRAISHKGAMGLMQLMPTTAEELGVEDSFDPHHNIHGGVKYFRQLLNEFDGDVELALAAYNAGIARVREYDGIPPFRATKIYIRKVLTYYRFYKELSPIPMESA